MFHDYAYTMRRYFGEEDYEKLKELLGTNNSRDTSAEV